MNMFRKLCFLVFFIFLTLVKSKRPNIVIILADDLGRNDIGLHGSSQIPTPNIDALGYNGIVLNKHYTLHICTPSRSALLTGQNPIRLGMQGYPLMAGEPRALPIHVPTIAQHLSKLGYKNHIIGKWHLGHENRSVTPLGRGFNSHLGIWSGFSGFFDYEIQEKGSNGFDLHRGYKPAFQNIGTYATDLFTEESTRIINNHNVSEPLFLYVSHLAPHTGKTGWLLETPNASLAHFKYRYIKNQQRQLYADIVNRLDTSVGIIVKALKKKNILDNTIILFLSDNGGQTSGFFANHASGWPFRGLKFTLYEGGVRNIAVLWNKQLKKQHYVENTLIHITDWLPTFYSAAGGNVADLGDIDGVNHWPLLSEGNAVPRRKDVLLNIDEKANFSGILSSDGRFKLVQGINLNGSYDGYFGDSGLENCPPYNTVSVLTSDVNKAILSVASSPLTTSIIWRMRKQLEIKQANAPRENDLNCRLSHCLFDLWNDPTETTDVSNDFPEIVEQLQISLASYWKELHPQTNKPYDPAADTKFCYGTWFNWKDPILKCDI